MDGWRGCSCGHNQYVLPPSPPTPAPTACGCEDFALANGWQDACTYSGCKSKCAQCSQVSLTEVTPHIGFDIWPQWGDIRNRCESAVEKQVTSQEECQLEAMFANVKYYSFRKAGDTVKCEVSSKCTAKGTG